MNDEEGVLAKPENWLFATPAVAAIFYPLLLQNFHRVVASSFGAATVLLAFTFCIPFLGFWVAMQLGRNPAPTFSDIYLKHLAWLTMCAPPLFVADGVITSMVKSSVADTTIWVVTWTILMLTGWGTYFISRNHTSTIKVTVRRVISPRLRMSHGVSALAIIFLFLAMHLTNHLVGLLGEAQHKALMSIFRLVYRERIIEPIVILLFLFQICTGMALINRMSALPADFFKSIQIASGAYLMFFILSHMNSVFIYARMLGGINTNWDFATGAPTGLINDAWNIRLVPHYFLGVFLVVCHLFLGGRTVALAHGYNIKRANQFTIAGFCFAAFLASAIMFGMIGVRLSI